MKRNITKLALFLALGSLTSIAVAWGCAMLIRYESGAKLLRLNDDPNDPQCSVIFSEFGSQCVNAFHKAYFDRFLPSFNVVVEDADPSLSQWSELAKHGQRSTHISHEEARGWPALCLSWRDVRTREYKKLEFGINTTSEKWNANILKPKYNSNGTLVTSNIGLIDSSNFGHHVLPLKPIWSGMALNVAFYASWWAILIIGVPFAVRTLSSQLRKRRGLCPKCGYDLRGEFTSGCSECGWQRVISQQTSA